MGESKERIKERIKQINIQIGDNVEIARIAAGFSAEELGKRIGVRQQQIFKYESGENQISPARLIMTAEALEVDISVLFNNTFNNSNTRKTKVDKAIRLAVARNFAKIRDPYEQRSIRKIIKETTIKNN